MGMKKLAKGMLIGALVGGAITLFDSETREEVGKDRKEDRHKSVGCRNKSTSDLE